jgi:NADH-quinone oxidoreductase subunit C
MMSTRIETLATKLAALFPDRLAALPALKGELAFVVPAQSLVETCRVLRDHEDLKFEQLIDLSGMDYLDYGNAEWRTIESTATGFSRGVNRTGRVTTELATPRFAVVYHLLSVRHNWRLRLRCYCEGTEPPLIDSLVDVWSGANWYEREAFDMFGILFKGHPDLRRILTDYGFIGHPFRKDFPLIGNLEVKYDPAKGRVVYQPVSIEARTLVPRVIRDDHRYEAALKGPHG